LIGFETFIYPIEGHSRTSREVTEALERFQALVEQSSFGVTIIQDGCFVYANSEAAAIFGYERARVRGAGDAAQRHRPAGLCQGAGEPAASASAARSSSPAIACAPCAATAHR
jgi:PAS domain-containing protein